MILGFVDFSFLLNLCKDLEIDDRVKPFYEVRLKMYQSIEKLCQGFYVGQKMIAIFFQDLINFPKNRFPDLASLECFWYLEKSSLGNQRSPWGG